MPFVRSGGQPAPALSAHRALAKPAGVARRGCPRGEAEKPIASGQFAYPDEIATAAVFFASHVADLLIDGGYTFKQPSRETH
jgi:hypothetical protein